MAWTEEDKQKAIDTYLEGEPTPENSTELIKSIADDLNQSANGVRMVLVQAGVYVKKDTTTSGTKTKTTTAGDKPARVSKEDSIAALRAALTDANKPVDEDILSKLTCKAAVYFLSVIK